jgi:predicted ATPase
MTSFNDSLENQKRTYNWNERRTSLRKWRISSFKSVKNSVEIELAPLTVVVGANSAGKSSLIQSILLVAQNASGVVRSSTSQEKGIFELNSFLVQLGTFKEVKCDLGRQNQNEQSFDLGGLWHLGSQREFNFNQRRPGEIRRMKTGESSIDLRRGEVQLDWGISLSSIRDNFESGVVPVSTAYATTVQDGLRYQTIEANPSKSDLDLGILSGKFDRFSFGHRSTVKAHDELMALETVTPDQLEDRLYKEKNIKVNFRSGLPISGLKNVGIVDYIFSHQSSVFSNSAVDFVNDFYDPGDPDSKDSLYENKVRANSSGTLYLTIEEAAEAFVSSVADIAQRILQQDKVGDDLTVSALAQAVEKNPLIPFLSIPLNYRQLFLENDKEVDAFLKSARSLFDKIYAQSDWVHSKILCSIDGRRTRQPVFGQSKTSRLVEYWNRYLSESVVYLGPLRASPKSTYGLGSGVENSNIPLGESGEFTAKKLFSEKNLKRYLVPENGKMVDKRTTLEEAVSIWYQELCITPESSDKIEVQAPGRQGYQMNLGSRALANVGFGVSQILPVITLCLIAEPGSLILLEQPELHLNPGMQQKLADFLLVMAKTGRQIIVETHSEYLITRLRRRAATDSSDHKYFGIIFAERNQEEGTSYRTVNVNDQGDLSEWPKGFFDHVAEDLRVLMRKAAERQASKDSKSVNKNTAKEE